MFTLIYKYEYGLLNYFVTLLGYDKQVWITPRTAIYLALIPVCGSISVLFRDFS